MAQKVKELADALLSESDWRLEVASGSTYLESKQTYKYPLPYYRVRSIIDLPRERLVNIVWNATYKSASIDDSTIRSLETLIKKENYKIKYQTNDMGFLLWTRETLFVQHKFVEDDVTWLVGYSILHPSVPLQNDVYVRTSLNMSVYKYTALTPTRTLVQRIVNINPNGNIPASIVKMYSGKLVDAFVRWQGLTS